MLCDGQRALPSESKALMRLATHHPLSLRFSSTHPRSNWHAELSAPISLPKLSPEGFQRKVHIDGHPPHTLANIHTKDMELCGGGGNGELRAVVA